LAADQQHTQNYDIIISGAGPAGCAAALQLNGSGLKVALLDKATFPRDKVCGDAIPGRAIKTLRAIDPAYADAFTAYEQKCRTTSTALYYKNWRIAFNWVQEAYTCARIDFDNFLLGLVRSHSDAAIHTTTTVADIKKTSASIVVTTKDGRTFEAPLLIAADGAQSPCVKPLTGRVIDKRHYAGSVRAYYEGVAIDDTQTTEVYFDKSSLPSYLWIFPLPGNRANVGFGMLSSEIAKRNVNIKQAFYRFIDTVPILQDKFRNAVQVSSLDGFGLPLGSGIGQLSGDRFMLAGDAASLIDPISGDGIGNAMLSGKLAAEQAIRSFQSGDFSATTMRQYDRTLHASIGRELRSRHRLQRLLSSMPTILDGAFAVAGNPVMHRLIQQAL
jgi:geranylgeranyl reductase family protein